jgi:hypothetical protein
MALHADLPFYLRVKYGQNVVDGRYKCHEGSQYVIKKLHFNVMGGNRSSTVGIATVLRAGITGVRIPAGDTHLQLRKKHGKPQLG